MSASAAFADSPSFTWSAPTYIGGIAPVRSVSCTASSLCVTGDSVGFANTTTNPGGGTAAWAEPEFVDDQETFEGEPLAGISCTETPSRLCVGADESGNIINSTDPTGGSDAWSLATPALPPGSGVLYGASCASSSLCVVVGQDDLGGGIILSSTGPTGSRSAWKQVVPEEEPEPGQHHPYGAYRSVSCPSSSLCVAVGEANLAGDVFTTTEPTGDAEDWRVAEVGQTGMTSVSCASTSLCVAVQSGAAYTSTDPAAGTMSWSPAEIDPGNDMTAVSCTDDPSLLCVAVDDGGNAVTSTDPTGGVGAWTTFHIDDESPLTSVSCASTTLCVAGDEEGNVLTPAGASGPAGSSGGGGSISPPVPVAPTKSTAGTVAKTTKCRKGFVAKKVKDKEVCTRVKKHRRHKRHAKHKRGR